MEKRKIVLTGDRPTGPLHLGHFVGSLENRIFLQDEYLQFIMIADAQALTDNMENSKEIYENILTVVIDYLSIGIDPERSNIFIQSQIPPIFEIALYYLNLVTWNRLKHNPTVKAEIKQKNFKEAIPAGFMIYPIFQAADITAFQADLVPVGEDQLPMIEQTVEIVRKFNRIYKKKVLKEPKALIPKFSRLPGTDGKTKMSKSLNNAIYLSDSKDTVAKKVKKMYTDPGHLKVEDPGKVEKNPVFIYLDAFGKDKQKIEELKKHYEKGGLADSKVKSYLLDILQNFLDPIRKKRELLEKDKSYILDILKKGNSIAIEKASDTLKKIKEAMGILKDF